MEDTRYLWLKIRGILTFLGLGLIGWGLWEFDPRIAIISVGFGLFLIGLNKI